MTRQKSNQLAIPAPALIKAEFPWYASRENISGKQQVLNKVQGILNKLTLENFDLLKTQLIDSRIITSEILEDVITMIFERAVFQPVFCPIYAQLCADLNKKLPWFFTEKNSEKTTFKRILLNKCQEMFEDAEERIAKLKTLGNIRFIVELWKHKMVTDRIVLHIIKELFGHDERACPNEENIEAICLIFNTIGKQLDENLMIRIANDGYFNVLGGLIANTQLTPRLRFMVQNVVDFRANNWPSRAEKSECAPSVIKADFSCFERSGNASEKEVLKRMKRILDILTVENYDLLEGQIIQSEILTPEILEGVVTMIFNKAIFQPNFCSLYARLCVDLHEELPSFLPEKVGDKLLTFRRLLLNKCQETFEGGGNLWSEINNLVDPNREIVGQNKERIVKLWTLGNIHFICELWKENLVPDGIVLHIIKELLEPDMKACPAEENVEALCLVFNTIGEQLDENIKIHRFNNACFKVLKDLTLNSRLTPRLRLMVQNVVDLRENQWNSCREEESVAHFNSTTFRAMRGLQKAVIIFEEFERGHRKWPNASFEPYVTFILCVVCLLLGIYFGRILR